MLTEMKSKFYNSAPMIFLKSVAETGAELVINNGKITDIILDQTKDKFNHAHDTTFVNNPAGTKALFN